MNDNMTYALALLFTLTVLGLFGWVMLWISWLLYKITERVRVGEWRIKQTVWAWCGYSALSAFCLSIVGWGLAEGVDLNETLSAEELAQIRADEVLAYQVVLGSVKLWVVMTIGLICYHVYNAVELSVGLIRGKYPLSDPNADAFG